MADSEKAPDVARDKKVVAGREEFLSVLRNYIQNAEKFADTGDWRAETEMLHIMQYDIPRSRKAVIKAMEKFYRKHPTGYAHVG